jgi:hypothetical protein
MAAHNLLQGAVDAWHHAPSHQAALSAGGLGMSHPVRPTECITSEMSCWATTPVQDSAESKATRHLDSPTDGGLEYLMSGNPQWPFLNHSLQFQAHSSPRTEHSR